LKHPHAEVSTLADPACRSHTRRVSGWLVSFVNVSSVVVTVTVTVLVKVVPWLPPLFQRGKEKEYDLCFHIHSLQSIFIGSW
jgi:hypothetical protein